MLHKDHRWLLSRRTRRGCWHSNPLLPPHQPLPFLLFLWLGVRCSVHGRVVRLILESAGLNGTLDRLDQLHILSLKSYTLAGPIPDLSAFLNLEALFLDRNLFTDPFPSSLLSLSRLRTLDLSHNRLSGLIPPANATTVDCLYCLRLKSNRFNGSLPPLNQSSLTTLNVSDNALSGPEPVTVALSAIDASAFSGNPGLCGAVVRKECGFHFLFFPGPALISQSPAAPAKQLPGLLLPGSASPTSQKMRKRAVVGMGFMAGAFLVIGLIGVLVVMKRKRMRQGSILILEKDIADCAHG